MGEVISMVRDKRREALIERANYTMIHDMGFDRHYLKFDASGMPADDWAFFVDKLIEPWSTHTGTPGVVVFGAVGTGKTTGVCLAIREIMIKFFERYDERAKEGRYMFYPNYRFARSTALVASLCSDNADDRWLAQACRDAELVVIDDLGADGDLPSWRKAKFEDFVTARWSNERPMIVTTNLADADGIAAVYGNATTDRLVDRETVWCHHWTTTVSRRSNREKFRSDKE